MSRHQRLHHAPGGQIGQRAQREHDHVARLDLALRAVRELKCGTVNVNEVPGFRVENSPFGGIKDSGLGVKEGVIEAIKGLSYVKTFSLPW